MSILQHFAFGLEARSRLQEVSLGHSYTYKLFLYLNEPSHALSSRTSVAIFENHQNCTY